MKRLTAYLAITAAALALAAAEFGDASASLKLRRAPDPAPQLTKPMLGADKPCALYFKPSKTGNFYGYGDSYSCTYAVLGHPCKKGYAPGAPAVVKVGNGWVIRYGCVGTWGS